MQVGVIGGICFLAFLLSEGSAEESDSLQESRVLQDIDRVKEAPNDLKNEISLDESQFDARTSEGSGDNAQNEDRSFSASAVSISAVQSSGEGYASADSESKASALARPSPFNPFGEELGPYKQPGSILTQAEAQAISGGTNSQGLNSYPFASPYPYSSGLSSAQSQADNGLYQPPHNINPQANGGFYQRDPVFNPYYGLSSIQTQNQAYDGLYQPGYNSLPNGSPYNQGSSYPQKPRKSDSGQISPIAFEDAQSKLILPFEYIFLNKVPGGENTIRCTKENEFHHFWSKELSCLICICLNDYGVLTPVCASCGGCRTPGSRPPEPVPRLPDAIPIQPLNPFEPIPIVPERYPDEPQPGPTSEPPTPGPYPVFPEYVPTPPVPVTFPGPVSTLPPQPAHAQCHPLPTGQPFTNPLHPCQICICRESYVMGKNEVQIECKDNPQCIAPDEVTALPPIPDEPQPVPLPICEKFPEHILFPHPTDRCKLCKCSKSLLQDGNQEQQITCYPHPECVPKFESGSEPIPLPPTLLDPFREKPGLPPQPLPIEPLKLPTEPIPALPEPVTVEPLPWPPITTTTAGPQLPALTPRPGPLPGPSPHESCQPYPPNQTFQHPWDECQVCMCTEATAVGMITVEVNCYTKPSCCIEIPVSGKPGLPVPGYTRQLTNGAAISDTVSQPITSTYKSPPAYPSYGPAAVNVNAGAKQVGDSSNQPPVFSSYMDQSNYQYQPGFAHRYVNTQFSDLPAVSPVQSGSGDTIGQYKSNNFGYSNYQYAQGDALGGTHPLHGRYHQYDPSFQSVPPPAYPGMYHRAYERPPMSPMFVHGQLRDSYVNPQIPAFVAPNPSYMAPSYAKAVGHPKSAKDGSNDLLRDGSPNLIT